MNSSEFRFTLDLHSSQSQVSLPVMAGDTGRTFYISLADGGAPYRIEDGCLAMLTITRPTGTFIQHFCMIEDNTNIVYKFSQNPNTAAVEGLHNCEVSLYDPAGDLLSSPRFSMVVSPRVVNKYDTDLDDDDRVIIDDIIIAEATRVEIDKERTAAEAERVAAEAERLAAEEARISAESKRLSAEEERIAAETLRLSEEEKRIKNETERTADETTRVLNEQNRVASENIRVENENIRVVNENTRAANEADRVSAEVARIKNEADRTAAEAERLSAESKRVYERNLFMEAIGKGEITFINADAIATNRMVTIPLLASAWMGSNGMWRQVANINGISEFSKVDLQPSAEQIAAFHEMDLALLTENDNGVVTVYAIGDKPTNDYAIQATITEVTA